MVRVPAATVCAVLLACGAAPPPGPQGSDEAAVLAVDVSGEPGGYSFSVTLRSPDTGCARYADWWEVLDEDEELVYRRILGHSHADEQPFARSGGPVAAAAGDRLIVRLHMHPDGYGDAAMQGTVADGFRPTTLPADHAAALEQAAPQPEGCAF